MWSLLAQDLAATPLPGEDGRSIRCMTDEFMPMALDGNGVAQFENCVTRNYLHPNCVLVVPKDGVWNRESLATTRITASVAEASTAYWPECASRAQDPTIRKSVSSAILNIDLFHPPKGNPTQ